MGLISQHAWDFPSIIVVFDYVHLVVFYSFARNFMRKSFGEIFLLEEL